MRYKFLIPIILALASNIAYAQDTLGIHLRNPHGPNDSTLLNPNFGKIIKYPKPPIYDTWFKRIVDCEGLTMPPQEEIDRISYYAVNSEGFVSDSTNITYDAITIPRKYTMIIGLPSVWDYDVIAHEFLHFVLWYDYGPKYQPPNDVHPQKYFGRCNIRAQ